MKQYQLIHRCVGGTGTGTAAWRCVAQVSLHRKGRAKAILPLLPLSPCPPPPPLPTHSARRLETNKLRNTAKLFAHLLSTDAIPWAVLQVGGRERAAL